MAAPVAPAWRSKTVRDARTAPQPAAKVHSGLQAVAAVKPAIEAGGQAVDERVLFVAQVLIGYTVQVQVKSGLVYEGIFHALRPADGDFDVLLRMAKVVTAPGDGNRQRDRPQPLLAIEGADLVQLTATDVRMGASDVGSHGVAWDDAGGFGTDSAISRNRGAWGRERELQRWAPDEGEASHMLHLEDSGGPATRGWDQFAVNEAKFGVRTNYAEELYTTELDPSKSKISVAEAARIAAEIERGDHSAMSNIHMLEERGVAIDDSQMDEKDRYGAVVRDTPQPRAPANGAGAAAAAAVPRPNAWAQGGPRPLLPGAAPSAPISIDTRREANKLRMQMTSSVKQTSPYGTPNAHKRPSPLSSPLISDPSKLEALNLNPGVPRLNEETRRDFEQFKAEQAASKSGDMFKKQDIQELRQFSQNIESKLSRSLGAESKMPNQPPSVQAAAGGAGEGGQAAAAGAAATPAPAGQLAAAPANDASKKSALNPFAKSFNFNINAKEFMPPTAAAAPPAAPAPAAAAPPPPAAAIRPQAAAPGPAASPVPTPGVAPTASAAPPGPPPPNAQPGPPMQGAPAGVGGFKQGPASPMRGPMQPSIPMPDMRPDFRRMPRGDGSDMDGGGPHPARLDRDSSFGRGRRDESRERGGPPFERRRDGRHYEGGPGMRPGEGGPPPPPPKGPGGPQGMQMSMMGQPMMMPPGMMGMNAAGQMVPVMMPGMGGGPGQPMFMVRPMGPGQPGMGPMMMQGGMMPGMGPGMMMVPPSAMNNPGQCPHGMMMGPQMMMMPGPGMGMMMPAQRGGGQQGGGGGGQQGGADSRE